MTATTDATLHLHSAPDAMTAYTQSTGLRTDEAALVAKYFPSAGARILDLGVGSGRTTAPLHNMGYHVTGIEYCADLVAAAAQLHPEVDIRRGDARSLPFPDAEFDAAWFSWNGIDYMVPFAERLQVLTEIHRVVRPGGVFLVSSHNALGCLYRLTRPVGLTVRGLQFLIDQLTFERPLCSWYCRWRDDALGKPLFYSAPPRRQVRTLKDCGWTVLDVQSVERQGQPASWWRDVHVNYVCRKP
ncbi:MAG: class I SAM-dependent methyltransferase [Planctomycetaceae bacterium]